MGQHRRITCNAETRINRGWQRDLVDFTFVCGERFLALANRRLQPLGHLSAAEFQEFSILRGPQALKRRM
jgi:hypothetical protein